MSRVPLGPQTLSLMRATIRRRLDEGATVREAGAEARGTASSRLPGCDPRQSDAAMRDLLTEIDALLPDLAPVEQDGRTYRPANDQEVASALAYALVFDQCGKPTGSADPSRSSKRASPIATQHWLGHVN